MQLAIYMACLFSDEANFTESPQAHNSK